MVCLDPGQASEPKCAVVRFRESFPDFEKQCSRGGRFVSGYHYCLFSAAYLSVRRWTRFREPRRVGRIVLLRDVDLRILWIGIAIRGVCFNSRGSQSEEVSCTFLQIIGCPDCTFYLQAPKLHHTKTHAPLFFA